MRRGAGIDSSMMKDGGIPRGGAGSGSGARTVVVFRAAAAMGAGGGRAPVGLAIRCERSSPRYSPTQGIRWQQKAGERSYPFAYCSYTDRNPRCHSDLCYDFGFGAADLP